MLPISKTDALVWAGLPPLVAQTINLIVANDFAGNKTGRILNDGGSDNTIIDDGTLTLFPNLPTSDPGVAGQIYSLLGVLNVSAG